MSTDVSRPQAGPNLTSSFQRSYSEDSPFDLRTNTSPSRGSPPHQRSVRRQRSDEGQHELNDPRRAVQEFSRQVSPEELRAPLPKPNRCHAATTSHLPCSPVHQFQRDPASPSTLARTSGCVSLFQRWKRGLANAIRRICFGDVEPATKDLTPPPRRWYRVHPITNTLFFVRPDAGLRGRIPGFSAHNENELEEQSQKINDKRSSAIYANPQKHPEQLPVRSTRHIKRSPSLPAEVERRCGLELDCLTDLQDCTCKICYGQPSDCLRRHMLSKPAHRGGRSCPLCRRPIREVIQIYNEAVFPQTYGYAIKADCFGGPN
jgi:hypothetical protein